MPTFQISAITLLLVAGLFLPESGLSQSTPPQQPIRVAVAGLIHGHAKRLFDELPSHPEIQLVGVTEPNTEVREKFLAKYHLAPDLFYPTLDALIDAQHPKIVLGYSSVASHRVIIETAARHGVDTLVEKPLTISLDDALAIRAAARENHVRVMVNYETTWYASNTEAMKQLADGKLGPARRVVIHDGHQGPAKIHSPAEFLTWLTDPKGNGAGALYDFGCYGADMMTGMMHGKAPISVTAVAQTDQPETYPKVDDDATIILRYPGTQAVLQPSWNWPFQRKDMEIYGATGYAITVGLNRISTRYAAQTVATETDAPKLPPWDQSSLYYLVAVERGTINPAGDLSSLETNMVVMQILDAARTSVATGRTVVLAPLPQ